MGKNKIPVKIFPTKAIRELQKSLDTLKILQRKDFTVAAGGNALDVARLEHIPRWSQHFLPKGGMGIRPFSRINAKPEFC